MPVTAANGKAAKSWADSLCACTVHTATTQVLDEADRLLDDSFGSEMECILGAVSEKRQTLLFSATMTQNLRTLRDLSMEDAFCFDAGGARYVVCAAPIATVVTAARQCSV